MILSCFNTVVILAVNILKFRYYIQSLTVPYIKYFRASKKFTTNNNRRIIKLDYFIQLRGLI